MTAVYSPEAEFGPPPEEEPRLPHSAHAERSVLGSILMDNDAMPGVVSILDKPDYFFFATHQEIYASMIALESKNRPIDLVLMMEDLESRGRLEKAGGIEYLGRLVDDCPTSANAEYYAQIVRARFLQRQLLSAARETLQDANSTDAEVDEMIDRAEQRIFEIAENRGQADVSSMRDILKTVFKNIEAYDSSEGVTGLSTGLIDLDELTSGLQKQNMIIVAARPSMGKTSFAMNIAEHVAIHERRGVAIFSLEVGKDMLVQNLLCSRARVSAHDLRKGKIDPETFQRLSMVASELQEAPIFINDDANTNLMRLRAHARRLKRRHDISLVVLDYLQLLDAGGGRKDSREQEISAISRGLKGLARELDVPVMALSQLNRESDKREDHRPRLADLRESGALEQDADVVMLLFREEYYHPDREEAKNKAEVIIAKQRNGPQGRVNLAFFKQWVRFDNLAHSWNEGVA